MRNIIICLALAACTTPDMIKTSSERNAIEYATDMGLDIKGVSCSARDSDMDGDTSCTLNMADGSTKAIECNYDVAIAPLGQVRGCKLVVFARGFSPTEQ